MLYYNTPCNVAMIPPSFLAPFPRREHKEEERERENCNPPSSLHLELLEGGRERETDSLAILMFSFRFRVKLIAYQTADFTLKPKGWLDVAPIEYQRDSWVDTRE